MAESVTDSDNEHFESAEESLDEDEEELEVEKLVEEKCLRNIETEGPDVPEKTLLVRDDSPTNGKDRDPVAYRKRPEKQKHLAKKSSTGSLTVKKGQRTDSIFKADAITPDHLFQDITTNLSKNINKSLSTIQQTSSNVKDLIMSSLPTIVDNQTEVFTYDDVSYNSPSSEGDNSLSKTLSQLSLSQITDVNLSTDENDTSSIELKSDNSYKSVSLFDNAKLIGKTCQSELKTNMESEAVKTKLFSSNLPITFNIPEISDFLKLTTNTNETDKYSVSSVTEKTSVKSKSIFEPKEEVNILEEVHSFTDSDKGKHTSWNSNTQCSSDISSKIEKASNILSADIIDRHPGQEEFIKNKFELRFQNRSPNELISEGKYIKQTIDACQVPYDKIRGADITKEFPVTNDNNLETKHLGLHMKQSDNKTKEPKPVQKDKKLLSSYKMCANETVSMNSDNKDSIEKPCDLSAAENVLLNAHISGSIQNKIDNERRSKDWVDFSIPSAQNTTTQDTSSKKFHETQQTQIAHNSVDEQGDFINEIDGWEDFDYSDSDTNKPESSTKINIKVPEENSSNIQTEEQMDSECSLINNREHNSNEISKISTKPVSMEDDKNRKNSVLPGPKFEKEKTKMETSDENKADEKGDDWDWDNWGDEADECEDINTVSQVTGETENSEMWSGWDTFGQKLSEKQSSSNWGSWGVNMLLDKATAVTQGISNALEAGLGAPDPQTLAMLDQKRNKRKTKEENNTHQISNEVVSSSDGNLFTFGLDLVAGVKSKIVEHSAINPAKFHELGTKVIAGGLDTLESFGKKTMEVLQEGDPGLRNKRALFLGTSQPVLSQVLKEVRDKAEREIKEVAEREIQKKCHFEALFDDYQGLIHLEALEMLSKQCELKLEQIRSSMNAEEQDDLDGVLEEVQQLCSLDDYDLNLVTGTGDFKKSLLKAVEPLKEEISVQKIIEIQEDVDHWLQSVNDPTPPIMLQKFVSTLARLTSAIVHQFHKGGELLSVKECRKTVEEIDALSEMTHILIMEISSISNNFIVTTKKLFRGTENLSAEVNKMDTVLNNSTSYIKQAFNLLIPVLQVGAAV